MQERDIFMSFSLKQNTLYFIIFILLSRKILLDIFGLLKKTGCLKHKIRIRNEFIMNHKRND